jgi:hypothetical protein
MPFCFIICF